MRQWTLLVGAYLTYVSSAYSGPTSAIANAQEVEAVTEPEVAGLPADLAGLEAEVLSRIDAGRDPKVPLERMWSLARTDEATATAYMEAMDRIVPHLESDEAAWTAQLWMAETAEYLKDNARVDQIYGDLVALDPDLQTPEGRSARYNHLQAMVERGDREAAIPGLRALWDHSAKYSPEEFEVFGFQLAVAQYDQGDWAASIEVYEAILNDLKDIHDYGIAKGLAQAYMNVERFDEAVALYQRLYNVLSKLQAENPNHPVFSLPTFQLDLIQRRIRGAEIRRDGKPHRDQERAHAASEAALVSDAVSESKPSQPKPEELILSQAPEVIAATVAAETPAASSISRILWGAMAGAVLVALVITVKLFR